MRLLLLLLLSGAGALLTAGVPARAAGAMPEALAGASEASAPGPQGAPATLPAAPADVSFRFAERREGHVLPLTDVHVAFEDAVTLARVRAAVSDGPFLVASVPPGRYRVTASHEGRAQAVDLLVAPGAPVSLAFYW